MIEGRPAPTSSGQFARTPLPHLLVYTHDRALTGTFEFRAPDASSASVLLIHGQPAKAKLSASSIYLGQVLLEMGVLDAPALDASLREWSGLTPRKLHGILLLERATITLDQLEQALRSQLLRKLAQIARMPAATVFEFYSDWDGLADFGGDPLPIDAMSAVWASIREEPPFEHVKAALERMTHGRLKLARTAHLDRFGFTLEEKRSIESASHQTDATRPLLLRKRGVQHQRADHAAPRVLPRDHQAGGPRRRRGRGVGLERAGFARRRAAVVEQARACAAVVERTAEPAECGRASGVRSARACRR